MISMALPLNIPWTTIAYTVVAPFWRNISAALARVPHVSAISSMTMPTLPFTWPTRVILETSFARSRSLWMNANGRSRRSATAVALLVSYFQNRYLPFCTPCVGGDDDRIVEVDFFADVAKHRRFGVKIIHGHIEKPLYLRRMEIHCL